MKKLISSIFALALITSLASAQSATDIMGKWKTIDDETGEAKSIVEIYEKGGKAYGKVIEVLNPDRKNAVCDKCSDGDPRKGQKVEGMVILTGLEKDSDGWEDGQILDPNNGKVYSCKIARKGENLDVRGYIGWSLIGRTQTWHPVK